MKFSNRLSRITEPQTIKMAKLTRALKAEGVNIVDLSLGEPDFATPQHIIAAATKAMEDGFTKYTPVAGIPDLRSAIVEKLKRDNALHYSPENILVSTGAKQSLANVILCLIDKGDEVIIPTPYWVTYSALVNLAEGTVKHVSCGIDTDFKITPAQLEAAITPATKMFIFSSPCNPTGSIYSKEELAALVQVFEKHPQVYIVSDEIYEYINYVGKHTSIASFPSVFDSVIVVNGFSKGYAMTGWRLGYIAAPKELVQACEKYQSQYTSGANAIAQKAGVAALLGDMAPTHSMVEAYKQRRDFVVAALRNMPNVKCAMPDGAFYAFPDISAFFGKSFNGNVIQNDEDLSMYLLHEGHLTTVNGSAFGEPHCIRISYATSMEQLTEAMKRMADALSKLV
ncbi:MAG: pyridoxal phosphate-dependent aminotransferase [Bacteroidota bacterium]|nr:pyridoxal phosphate-dependent aminotransferase [Bacteroidota bacterium]